MAQVLALPRYAVLKCRYNLSYLSYRPTDKYLPLKGDDVLSMKSKFAIEPTNIGNGLVHLRCCYNNRYFVKNFSGFLVANATKINEDTSSDKCTLFEPIAIDDNGTVAVRFRHVQSGAYARLYYTLTDPILDACLYATQTSPNDQLKDAYEVIDWESLVKFPTHNVVFKGSNNKYLGVTSHVTALEFRVLDKNGQMAPFKVEPAGDGSVYIFSQYFKRYLSLAYFNIILPNIAEKSSQNRRMLFKPIKLGGNVIALRNADNDRFLSACENDGAVFLMADQNTITAEAHLTVEELAVSKSIYNVVYRLNDGRIYNEAPIVCGYGEDTNDSDQQDTMELRIKCEEIKITSWNNSASIGVDVSTSFKTGIPFIAEGEIDIDVSANYEHQWGGQKDESYEKEVTFTSVVGPRTHVKVTYVASKGTCDVPFSYTESATYSDGTSSITIMDDGLYTGINSYNYSFVKKESPLR